MFNDIPSATVPKRDPRLSLWAGAGGGAWLTSPRHQYKANQQNNLKPPVTTSWNLKDKNWNN